MRTALYRHFDAAGRLLYVGISLSAVQRLGQHRDNTHWFEAIASVSIEWLPSRAEALEAERRAITTEHPAHNVQHARAEQAAAASLDLSPRMQDVWAKNEVRCAGDPLGREIFRGAQWAVTTDGIECRDGTYFICRSRLYEENGRGWVEHIAGKAWANAADFRVCFRIACEVFPRGTKRSELGDAGELTHPWVGMFLHTFKDGRLSHQGRVVSVLGQAVRVCWFSWMTGCESDHAALSMDYVASDACRRYSTRDEWLNAAEALQAQEALA